MDVLSGEIMEVHTHEQAENAGFHHSNYVSDRAVNNMKEEKWTFFFISDINKRISGHPYDLPDGIEDKIAKQIIKL